MTTRKINLNGSGYVGAFATATDRHLFIHKYTNQSDSRAVADSLDVEMVQVVIASSEITGVLCRANKTGILVSNLVEDSELQYLRSLKLGMNVEVLGSMLNAIGNNVLVNDKIALVNPEYSARDVKQIGDVLGVEVIKLSIGGFNTVGANNILTNKGFVINNRASDEEKENLDKLLGFDSVRTTAGTGSLNVGLTAVANSRGLVVGEDTTGFELARLMEGLDLE
jgi:translation initiation factor 6